MCVYTHLSDMHVATCAKKTCANGRCKGDLRREGEGEEEKARVANCSRYRMCACTNTRNTGDSQTRVFGWFRRDSAMLGEPNARGELLSSRIRLKRERVPASVVLSAKSFARIDFSSRTGVSVTKYKVK